MPYTHVYRNPATKVVTVTNGFYAKKPADVLMTNALDHDPEDGDAVGSAGTHTLFTHVQELFFKARLHDVENYSIVTNDAVDPG